MQYLCSNVATSHFKVFFLAEIPDNISSYAGFCVSYMQVVCTDTWKTGSYYKPDMERGIFHSCRSCSLPLNLESQSLLCKRRNLGCWGAELLKGLSCSHLRDQQGLKYFETNLQIRVIITMLLRKPNLLASRTVRKRPKSFCGRNLVM